MAKELSIVNCLVIGQERIKEFDMRLTVFTDVGASRFNATGILRPSAKLRGVLQLFNHVELSTMGHRVMGAHVIKNNTAISRDVNRFYLASSICETLASLLREPDDYTDILALATETLSILADTDASCFRVFIDFYSKLLAILGFDQEIKTDDDLGLARAREIIKHIQDTYIRELEFQIPLVNHFL